MGLVKSYAGGSNCVLKDWNFSSATPTSLVDKSGAGNDGVFTDITAGQLASGLWKYAFNGTTSKIVCADSTTLNVGTGDFSLLAWVKLADDVAFQVIMYKGSSGAGGKRYDIHKDDNTGYLAAEVDDDTVTTVWGGATKISDATYHFVGATFDRDGNGQLYVDGVADGNATSLANTTNTLDDVGKDLHIGMNGHYDSIHPASGDIAAPRIFKGVVLSEAQMLVMFNYERNLIGV